MNNQRFHIIYLTGLIILTFIIFAPSISFEFVNLDDHYYVLNNFLIRDLSLRGIGNIFANDVMGNYQPMIVLSLALDYIRFKLLPSGYHTTNILLHLINVLLVYGFLRLLKLAYPVIFLGTFIFALHPLRVESVAWITERKDVLFMFFYMSSINVYLIYAQNRLKKNLYFLSLVLFVCALLSKPAAVTLPLLLLLLDWYQFGKIKSNDFYQKIPFFIFSLLLGAVTLYGYNTPFDYGYLKSYSFTSVDHFFMGFYSLILYIHKLIWPVQMVCYYPYPEKVNGLLPIFCYFSPLIAVGVAMLFYRIIQDKKIFILGGLFFIITISLNLAFLNFGNVIIADRYTYLPSVGFFIIILQIVYERISSSPKGSALKLLTISLISFSLLMMCAQTFRQLSHWKNSETLWKQVLRYYPGESAAYYNLGSYYASINNLQDAVHHYSKAIEFDEYNYSAYINRGGLYLLLENDRKAIIDFNRALELDPSNLQARWNRIEYYRLQKQYNHALNDLIYILSQNPEDLYAQKMKNNIIEKMKTSF